MRGKGAGLRDYRVLGAVEAYDEAGRLDIGSGRPRRLLAVLLVHANDVVSNDRLVEAVWPDEPPTGEGLGALRTAVSRLRTTLDGADLIVTHPAGYQLVVADGELDAARFEAMVTAARHQADTADHEAARETLDRAMALWRGPAYAEFGAEQWAHAEVARLDELRALAGEARVDALLATGLHAEAAGELERLIEAGPFRDRPRAQLLIALYRSGRQAEALRAYDDYRRLLRDELGLEPSEELQALERQVLARDASLDPPTSVGRPLRGYRVGELIGEGRFGAVYRAMQPSVQRDVAIKVIHPELANDATFIRRFEAEARLVAQIEHPHVVPLYDYWRDSTGAYLVMRYMRAGNLAELLDRQPPGPDASLEVLAQVGGALEAAHAAGVTHGDVKLENVLVDDAGNAYLADFGIAVQAVGRHASPAADIVGFVDLAAELLADHAPAGSRLSELLGDGRSDDSIQRILDDLAAALAPGLAVAASGDAGLRNPYKGLRPFGEADVDDFFGRADLVDRVVARLASDGPPSRFVGVVGPSGSGKSSVVRAGLLPSLRRGAVDGSDQWFMASLIPGDRPFERLAAALVTVAVDPPEGLADRLRADGLAQAARHLLPGRGDLLLVVDQFEELFTAVDDEAERRAFMAMLTDAAIDQDSRVRVVITLRADFYDRPLEDPLFGPVLGHNALAVTPLTPGDLEAAITGPAERVGVQAEPALLARMIADCSHQQGALPLLQFALTELFDRRVDGRMTLAAYEDLGGIAGAVAQRADQQFGQLEAEEREAARQVFLRLVAVDATTADARRRVTRTELRAVAPGSADRIIDAFGALRLLSFDRDATTRDPTVEVAHEALLRDWDRLRHWIEDSRADIRTHRALVQLVGDWEHSGRDESFLLAGTRLADIEAWADATDLALTAAERGYIDASQAARARAEAEEAERKEREARLERRSVRRLRAVVGVLAVAALVAAGLSVFGFQQRDRAEDQADIARRRELAAAAEVNLSVDPQLSLLLGLEAAAGSDEPLPESLAVIRAALARNRALVHYDWDPELPLFASNPSAVTLDGGRLAVTGDGSLIQIVDDQTGELLATYGEPTPPPSEIGGFGSAPLDVSPDGTLLASVDALGRLRLVDVNSGLARLEVEAHQLGPGKVAFSPDGRFVASAGGGTDTVTATEVILWDVDSGEQLARWSASHVNGIAFSADSRRIAATQSSLDNVAVFDVDEPQDRSGLVVLGNAGFFPVGVTWGPGPSEITVASMFQNTAEVWDVDTGERVRTFEGHDSAVLAVAVSPTGDLVATGSGDQTIRLWDAASGREAAVIEGHASGVGAVRFDSTGERLLSTASDGSARAWGVGAETTGELLTIDAGGKLWFVDVTRDGSLITAYEMDTAVLSVWDGKSGDLISTSHQSSPIGNGAFSPTGDRVLASPGGEILDPMTGEILVRLGTPTGENGAFSPDGQHVAGGAGRFLQVLDASSGERVAAFGGFTDRVVSAAFSADGAMVAAGGGSADGIVRVWDLDSGEELFVGDHEGLTTDVAFSPNGTVLASGSLRGTARLWNLEDRSLIHELDVGGSVGGVAFSPDGRSVVTGGQDGVVRVWDVFDGTELAALPGHSSDVLGVQFTQDGQTIVSSGNDGTIRVFTLDTDELQAIGRDALTRSFTDAECRQYLRVDACP